ncbi:restriction endonuclease [Streptomyces sp. NPDC058739]|uniref:restriction endonuclease n=1 Tax=Streptomyces sp. NPDC058739 TaxID=3346618 RepID=UPI0036CAE035
MRGAGLRRPRGAAEIVSAAVVVLAALVLVVRMVTAAAGAVVRAWPVVTVVAVLMAAAVLWRVRQATLRTREDARRLAALRLALAGLDAMDDRAFEYALRDLLVRDGWPSRRVGGRGDQAADVIGDHPLLGRIVVQAKHTKVGAKVGASVMYKVNGTAGPAHGGRHAVVVTNGTFTRDAMAWGERYGVHWVDRERLRRWAENGEALHALLGLTRRPRPHRFRRAA